MGKIQVLSKEVSELIAAGEVIERPASIVKELLENSIDAGASAVTVELRRGGVGYLRITDNGGGIAPEDVPTAFLRHATSKIRLSDDLNFISTLGFRGEALASIAAVSRLEMITKPADLPYGAAIKLEGGEQRSLDEAGCPDGTTIVVRDLFYNVPARLKFLRRDVSEGNAAAGVVDKLALSHPEISFKCICEGKIRLHTPGDGKLLSAIHAVFGLEFAGSLLAVDYGYNGVSVKGYTSSTQYSRNNRSMQHFFVNGRYVRSKVCAAALEEGYKNSLMVGKYPFCVLNVAVPCETVDVNVHPAKTEVRFVNERAVFDAVYFAVKSALSKEDILKTASEEASRSQRIPNLLSKFQPAEAEQLRMAKAGDPVRHSPSGEAMPAGNTAPSGAGLPGGGTPAGEDVLSSGDALSCGDAPADTVASSGEGAPPPDAASGAVPSDEASSEQAASLREDASRPLAAPSARPAVLRSSQEEMQPSSQPLSGEEYHFLRPELLRSREKTEAPPRGSSEPDPFKEREITFVPEEAAPLSVRILGEVFGTYVLFSSADTLYLLDKHAAHERILFERLKKSVTTQTRQILLKPVVVSVSPEERQALLDNEELMAKMGFLYEDFGSSALILREVPLVLAEYDLADLLLDTAQKLLSNRRDVSSGTLENLLHSIACRSAIKAHDETSIEELTELLRQVYADGEIRHCPHGRPVAVALGKKEIERLFGRS